MKNKYLIILLLLFSFSCSPNKKETAIRTADKDALQAAKEMFSLFERTAEKGFMIGHQDSPAYGIGWKAEAGKLDSDVFRLTGDFPAVFGWDIGGIELDNPANLDGVSFEYMRNSIVQLAGKGALNTISWHLRNPVTGESTWSKKETVKLIFGNDEILKKYHSWLEKAAVFFLSLKNPDGSLVPVIFRPFHEQDADWFWWGEAYTSKDDYIRLWQYTFKTLTEEFGVHNLLFSFSPNFFTNREEYLFKYPGNEYVDILGFDHYFLDDDIDKYSKFIENNLKVLKAISIETNKPFALTETGYEHIPSDYWYCSTIYPLLKESGASWVLFWRNYNESHHYVPYPGHQAANDFIEFCKYPETLLLSDIQDNN